jgi:hypothetical protein
MEVGQWSVVPTTTQFAHLMKGQPVVQLKALFSYQVLVFGTRMRPEPYMKNVFVCEEGQSLERAWLQRGLRTTQGRNRSEPADTQHCRDAMEIDNSVWFKSAV